VGASRLASGCLCSAGEVLTVLRHRSQAARPQTETCRVAIHNLDWRETATQALQIMHPETLRSFPPLAAYFCDVPENPARLVATRDGGMFRHWNAGLLFRCVYVIVAQRSSVACVQAATNRKRKCRCPRYGCGISGKCAVRDWMQVY